MKNQSTGASSGAVPVVAPNIVPNLPKMQQQTPGAAGAPTRPGDGRITWKRYTYRALRSLGSNDNFVDEIIAPYISQFGLGSVHAPIHAHRGYGT